MSFEGDPAKYSSFSYSPVLDKYRPEDGLCDREQTSNVEIFFRDILPDTIMIRKLVDLSECGIETNRADVLTSRADLLSNRILPVKFMNSTVGSPSTLELRVLLGSMNLNDFVWLEKAKGRTHLDVDEVRHLVRLLVQEGRELQSKGEYQSQFNMSSVFTTTQGLRFVNPLASREYIKETAKYHPSYNKDFYNDVFAKEIFISRVRRNVRQSGIIALYSALLRHDDKAMGERGQLNEEEVSTVLDQFRGTYPEDLYHQVANLVCLNIDQNNVPLFSTLLVTPTGETSYFKPTGEELRRNFSSKIHSPGGFFYTIHDRRTINPPPVDSIKNSLAVNNTAQPTINHRTISVQPRDEQEFGALEQNGRGSRFNPNAKNPGNQQLGMSYHFDHVRPNANPGYANNGAQGVVGSLPPVREDNNMRFGDRYGVGLPSDENRFSIGGGRRDVNDFTNDDYDFGRNEQELRQTRAIVEQEKYKEMFPTPSDQYEHRVNVPILKDPEHHYQTGHSTRQSPHHTHSQNRNPLQLNSARHANHQSTSHAKDGSHLVIPPTLLPPTHEIIQPQEKPSFTPQDNYQLRYSPMQAANPLENVNPTRKLQLIAQNGDGGQLRSGAQGGFGGGAIGETGLARNGVDNFRQGGQQNGQGTFGSQQQIASGFGSNNQQQFASQNFAIRDPETVDSLFRKSAQNQNPLGAQQQMNLNSQFGNQGFGGLTQASSKPPEEIDSVFTRYKKQEEFEKQNSQFRQPAQNSTFQQPQNSTTQDTEVVDSVFTRYKKQQEMEQQQRNSAFNQPQGNTFQQPQQFQNSQFNQPQGYKNPQSLDLTTNSTQWKPPIPLLPPNNQQTPGGMGFAGQGQQMPPSFTNPQSTGDFGRPGFPTGPSVTGPSVPPVQPANPFPTFPGAADLKKQADLGRPEAFVPDLSRLNKPNAQSTFNGGAQKFSGPLSAQNSTLLRDGGLDRSIGPNAFVPPIYNLQKYSQYAQPSAGNSFNRPMQTTQLSQPNQNYQQSLQVGGAFPAAVSSGFTSQQQGRENPLGSVPTSTFTSPPVQQTNSQFVTPGTNQAHQLSLKHPNSQLPSQLSPPLPLLPSSQPTAQSFQPSPLPLLPPLSNQSPNPAGFSPNQPFPVQPSQPAVQGYPLANSLNKGGVLGNQALLTEATLTRAVGPAAYVPPIDRLPKISAAVDKAKVEIPTFSMTQHGMPMFNVPNPSQPTMQQNQSALPFNSTIKNIASSNQPEARTAITQSQFGSQGANAYPAGAAVQSSFLTGPNVTSGGIINQQFQTGQNTFLTGPNVTTGGVINQQLQTGQNTQQPNMMPPPLPLFPPGPIPQKQVDLGRPEAFIPDLTRLPSYLAAKAQGSKPALATVNVGTGKSRPGLTQENVSILTRGIPQAVGPSAFVPPLDKLIPAAPSTGQPFTTLNSYTNSTGRGVGAPFAPSGSSPDPNRPFTSPAQSVITGQEQGYLQTGYPLPLLLPSNQQPGYPQNSQTQQPFPQQQQRPPITPTPLVKTPDLGRPAAFIPDLSSLRPSSTLQRPITAVSLANIIRDGGIDKSFAPNAFVPPIDRLEKYRNIIQNNNLPLQMPGGLNQGGQQSTIGQLGNQRPGNQPTNPFPQQPGYPIPLDLQPASTPQFPTNQLPLNLQPTNNIPQQPPSIPQKPPLNNGPLNHYPVIPPPIAAPTLPARKPPGPPSRPTGPSRIKITPTSPSIPSVPQAGGGGVPRPPKGPLSLDIPSPSTQYIPHSPLHAIDLSSPNEATTRPFTLPIPPPPLLPQRGGLNTLDTVYSLNLGSQHNTVNALGASIPPPPLLPSPTQHTLSKYTLPRPSTDTAYLQDGYALNDPSRTIDTLAVSRRQREEQFLQYMQRVRADTLHSTAHPDSLHLYNPHPLMTTSPPPPPIPSPSPPRDSILNEYESRKIPDNRADDREFFLKEQRIRSESILNDLPRKTVYSIKSPTVHTSPGQSSLLNAFRR